MDENASVAILGRSNCYSLCKVPAVRRETSSRVMKMDKVQGFEDEVLFKN